MAVIDLFTKEEIPAGGLPRLSLVPENSAPGKIPEDDAAQEFLARYKGKSTAGDYARDMRYWREFLAVLEKDLWSALTPDGTDWAAFELDVNERSPKTVHRYLSTVSSFYKYVGAEGYHDRNPVANVIRPPLSGTPYLGPALSDLGLLAEHLRCHVDLRTRATIMLLMTTGLRVSELCKARVEGLSRRDGKIRLRVVRKGGHEDDVEVPRATVEVLMAYMGNRASGPLILGNQSGGISRTTVWRMVRDLGDAVLPHLEARLHPHMFRHAFVTAVLILTGEVTEAQWRAGHRDINTTMTYVHGLKAQESTTPDQLEELFGLTC